MASNASASFSNNPQTAYNGLISGQRNMFLSSSVAVVIIGFSNTFDSPVVQFAVKLMGAFIF